MVRIRGRVLFAFVFKPVYLLLVFFFPQLSIFPHCQARNINFDPEHIVFFSLYFSLLNMQFNKIEGPCREILNGGTDYLQGANEQKSSSCGFFLSAHFSLGSSFPTFVMQRIRRRLKPFPQALEQGDQSPTSHMGQGSPHT